MGKPNAVTTRFTINEFTILKRVVNSEFDVRQTNSHEDLATKMAEKPGIHVRSECGVNSFCFIGSFAVAGDKIFECGWCLFSGGGQSLHWASTKSVYIVRQAAQNLRKWPIADKELVHIRMHQPVNIRLLSIRIACVDGLSLFDLFRAFAGKLLPIGLVADSYVASGVLHQRVKSLWIALVQKDVHQRSASINVMGRKTQNILGPRLCGRDDAPC